MNPFFFLLGLLGLVQASVSEGGKNCSDARNTLENYTDIDNKDYKLNASNLLPYLTTINGKEQIIHLHPALHPANRPPGNINETTSPDEPPAPRHPFDQTTQTSVTASDDDIQVKDGVTLAMAYNWTLHTRQDFCTIKYSKGPTDSRGPRASDCETLASFMEDDGHWGGNFMIQPEDIPDDGAMHALIHKGSCMMGIARANTCTCMQRVGNWDVAEALRWALKYHRAAGNDGGEGGGGEETVQAVGVWECALNKPEGPFWGILFEMRYVWGLWRWP